MFQKSQLIAPRLFLLLQTQRDELIDNQGK